MSIADHFEHAPDAGLIRDYDSGSARRQFRVSVSIIMVLVVACALAAIINFDGPSQQVAAPISGTPAYAGHL